MATANVATVEEQSRIVAALCADAPTDCIRNCLRKYDPKKTTWQIEALFKKDKKDVLVETLGYLGVPDMQQYRADALPHELIVRVQNLLPDTCHLCKNTYCISLGDKPILSCVRCGQGSHNSCVLQLLGISEQELTEENHYGADIVNPYATLGLFYICDYCQKDALPQKEALKVKQGGNRQNQNTSSTNIVLSTDSSTSTDAPNGGHDRPESSSQENRDANQTSTEQQSQTSAPVVDESNQATNRYSQTANDDNTGRLQQNLVVNNRRTTNARNTVRSQHNPAVDNRPICTFLKQGRCKHGLSGKTDGTCPHRHPQTCRKFLANGNRNRGGCKRGESCYFFHPQLCFSSLQSRTCLREDCKFVHIKGTRRSDAPPPSSRPGTQTAQQAQPIHQTSQRNGRHPQMQVFANQQTSQENAQKIFSPQIGQSNTQYGSFLDQIKTMQEQMTFLTSKIQQLDQGYSNLCLQPPGFNLPYRHPGLLAQGKQAIYQPVYPYPGMYPHQQVQYNQPPRTQQMGTVSVNHNTQPQM